jgi:hypothetical protein
MVNFMSSSLHSAFSDLKYPYPGLDEDWGANDQFKVSFYFVLFCFSLMLVTGPSWNSRIRVDWWWRLLYLEAYGQLPGRGLSRQSPVYGNFFLSPEHEHVSEIMIQWSHQRRWLLGRTNG